MARAWSDRQGNPVSAILYALTVAAVAILVIGMILTWQNANPGNTLVHWDLRWAKWLAGPFDNVFDGGGDAKKALYENWALAAAVYYVAGHAVSYLTRW